MVWQAGLSNPPVLDWQKMDSVWMGDCWSQIICSTSLPLPTYIVRGQQQLLPTQAFFPPRAASRYWTRRCKYICLLPFVVSLTSCMSWSETDGPWHCTGICICRNKRADVKYGKHTRFVPWRFKLRLLSQFEYLNIGS